MISARNACRSSRGVRAQVLVLGCLLSRLSFAQMQPPYGSNGPVPQPTIGGAAGVAPAGPTAYPPTYSAYTPPKTRSNNEMTFLYATSAVYGVGLGAELSSEFKIKDPGLFLIAPVLLGAAAPAGAYALDQPKMRRGLPTAIAGGLLLGTGEGLGIAGTQMVSARSSDAWGFRGLSRATTVGATLGGVGGWLAGTYLEPPPNTVVLTLSGAVWGTAIGSMFGYGASPGNYSWGRANDWAAVGGLIGYNVGALGAASTGLLRATSNWQLMWMWAGAGIGAAASLPIFLFYAGDGGPPARRGFVFMGTATTVGIVAGGVFAAAGSATSRRTSTLTVAHNDSMVELVGLWPYWNDHQAGLVAIGTLQ